MPSQDFALPDLPKEADEVFKKKEALLDKFKKSVIKEHKDVTIGISLLPPAKILPTDTPELKERLKKQINVLVLIEDVISKSKEGYIIRDKVNKSVSKKAQELDKDLIATVMDIYELRESCFDGKYDIIETIAAGFSLYDPKELLAALRISVVHRKMVLQRFEKYIVSYVCVGSLFRGDATSNDIDVAVVVDDTDVKKMTRVELKDKLGAIIRTMGFDAAQLTKVKKEFHIQTYILTDFWESVKDAHPVIYTFLRDGVPIYDRGVFMPWKLLLKMGRIRPSPEAIDMQMDLGSRLISRTKGKMISIIGEDLYYAILNPAQAALMLYGIAPPTPKETIELMDEIFVKKEKLLEKKYVDILSKIRQYYKDIEHGKLKEVKGKDIDELLAGAEDYLERIKKLFDQIQKRRDKEAVDATYTECTTLIEDVLVLNKISFTKTNQVVQFKKHLVDTKKFPHNYLAILKEVIDLKENYTKKKMKSQEIEKVNREARKLMKGLMEYIQRKRGYELERAKLKFKYGDKFGEVYLFDNVAFIIPDTDAREREVQKAILNKDGSLGKIDKSSLEELEQNIAKVKIPNKVFIKEPIFENLRNLFGKDVEILVNY